MNYQGKWRKILLYHKSFHIIDVLCKIYKYRYNINFDSLLHSCFLSVYYFVYLILLSSVFSFPSSIGEMPGSYINVVTFLWMEKSWGESQGEGEADGIWQHHGSYQPKIFRIVDFMWKYHFQHFENFGWWDFFHALILPSFSFIQPLSYALLDHMD